MHMEEGHSPVFNDENYKRTYDKCLHYLETLCRVTHPSTSASPHQPEHQSNDRPQMRRQRQRRQHNSSTRIDNRTPYLVPSDHLSILKLGDAGSMGMLVSRFWFDHIDDGRNFFLRIHQDDNTNQTESSSIPTFAAPSIAGKGSHREAAAN